MTHLAITLRYLGSVVEQRVVRLRDGMRLGDVPDAEVSFPRAVLTVLDGPRGWTVGGRRLLRGRVERFRLGDVEVWVEAVHGATADGVAVGPPNLPVLLMTAAVLLTAAWLDAAVQVLDRNPELAQGLEALVFSSPEAATAPARPAPVAEVRGPAWRPAVRLQPAPGDAGPPRLEQADAPR